MVLLFIVQIIPSNVMCFIVIPPVFDLCKNIEAACKVKSSCVKSLTVCQWNFFQLRYQKCLDAHPTPVKRIVPSKVRDLIIDSLTLLSFSRVMVHS